MKAQDAQEDRVVSVHRLLGRVPGWFFQKAEDGRSAQDERFEKGGENGQVLVRVARTQFRTYYFYLDT